MHQKRISLRRPFEGIYNGRTPLDPSKKESLPSVWDFLQEVRTGKHVIRPPPGLPKVFIIRQHGPGRRPRDDIIFYLAIGVPDPDDPDHDCDLFVQNIWWPEDLN